MKCLFFSLTCILLISCNKDITNQENPTVPVTMQLPPEQIYQGYAQILPTPPTYTSNGPVAPPPNQTYYAVYHGVTIYFSDIVYQTGAWNEGDIAILASPISVSFNNSSSYGTYTVDISYDEDGAIDDASFSDTFNSSGPTGTFSGRIIRTALSPTTLAIADNSQN